MKNIRLLVTSVAVHMKSFTRGLPLLSMLASQGVAQGLDGLKLQDEQFTYKFSQDKEPIQGILIKPSGNGPFPAVVVNHGKGGSAKGFGRQAGSNFIEKGYVVIACDLTHAGKAEGDNKPFGGSQENADRIMACVKILESLSYVNTKKLCIYGNSMGAFATVGTCTQTDKFKVAAITAGGVGKVGKLHSEENVPKITAPFIMCHGGVDTTVPLENDEKFKAAMDANKKIAELHIFEGIGHPVWKEKADEVFALILEFFEKHLK